MPPHPNTIRRDVSATAALFRSVPQLRMNPPCSRPMLDKTAIEADPSLASFAFEAGSHRAARESPIGREIYKLFTSRVGLAMIVGAVAAGPSRPPVWLPSRCFCASPAPKRSPTT